MKFSMNAAAIFYYFYFYFFGKEVRVNVAA